VQGMPKADHGAECVAPRSVMKRCNCRFSDLKTDVKAATPTETMHLSLCAPVPAPSTLMKHECDDRHTLDQHHLIESLQHCELVTPTAVRGSGAFGFAIDYRSKRYPELILKKRTTESLKWREKYDDADHRIKGR